MNVTITKFAKIVLIYIISFLLTAIPALTLSNTISITIDVNNVISDVSNNPVGINVNFLRDNRFNGGGFIQVIGTETNFKKQSVLTSLHFNNSF